MGPHWEIYSQQQLYGKCWSSREYYYLLLITNMLSLSMCYCDLGVSSGTTLGNILTTTAVR